MTKEITTAEDLINIILGMNGPRAAGEVPLQSGASVPTPFGKITLRVLDYDFVSTDPTLKQLELRSAKDTTVEEIVRQTLGSYRDAYRRSLAMCKLVTQGVHAIKAENTSIWLLEGKRTAKAPDAPNKKWKVVAMVSIELPGDKELALEVR